MAQIVDGSSLAGTSAQELSAAIDTHRNCVIQITNQSFEPLTDPNTYCHSGYCYSPAQPTVEGRTRDACSFSKTADAATGAVGVLTYNVGNSGKRLALMFSVPYDFNLYDSWFGVAFIDPNTPADEHLFKEMYYGSESVDMPDKKRAKAKDGVTLHVNQDEWKVSATMSEAKRAIMQVEVMQHSGGTEFGGAPYPNSYPPQYGPGPQQFGWSAPSY